MDYLLPGGSNLKLKVLKVSEDRNILFVQNPAFTPRPARETENTGSSPTLPHPHPRRLSDIYSLLL